MVNTILSGVIGFIMELVVTMFDSLCSVFFVALGCDVGTFVRMFPAATAFFNIILGAGVGLLIVIWIFQLMKSFGSAIGIEAESPANISLKSALFLGLTVFSGLLSKQAVSMGSEIYNAIMGAELTSNLNNLTANIEETSTVLDSLLTGASTIFIASSVSSFGGLIFVIFLAFIGINLIKLLFESVERYLVVCVMVFTAPLAFATGASKDTENIFKSWCRMLGGQIVLLIMNAWCIRVFLSAVGELGNINEIFTSNPAGNLILYFFLLIGFLKVSQKIDSFMQTIGVNVGQTGGDMIAEIMTASKMITTVTGKNGLGGFISKGSGGGAILSGAGAASASQNMAHGVKGGMGAAVGATNGISSPLSSGGGNSAQNPSPHQAGATVQPNSPDSSATAPNSSTTNNSTTGQNQTSNQSVNAHNTSQNSANTNNQSQNVVKSSQTQQANSHNTANVAGSNMNSQTMAHNSTTSQPQASTSNTANTSSFSSNTAQTHNNATGINNTTAPQTHISTSHNNATGINNTTAPQTHVNTSHNNATGINNTTAPQTHISTPYSVNQTQSNPIKSAPISTPAQSYSQTSPIAGYSPPVSTTKPNI